MNEVRLSVLAVHTNPNDLKSQRVVGAEDYKEGTIPSSHNQPYIMIDCRQELD